MTFRGNGSAAATETSYARQRAEMVEKQLRRRGIRDEQVLEAMRAVPRHEFVAPQYRGHAYDDRPISIGAGQTISQPYMVAVMTEALMLAGTEKILEVGTGSGYQAAVLSRLAARIHTIEREPRLLAAARSTLERLGRAGMVDPARIEWIEGDGSLGHAAAAPYDGILVAAGAPAVPARLVEQLAEGGRLVVPVGDRENQQLLLLQKSPGRLLTRIINECRFVPLVGEHGWKE